MKLKTFSVEFPGIEEVKPYFRNSKIHTSRQIKDVAQSIKRFGFDQPIVVDSNMVIIKGHGRYFAAQYLKLKNIPVIVRDDLSSGHIKAARIADNRIFEMTTIDLEAHTEELDSIAGELESSTSTLDFIDSPEDDDLTSPPITATAGDYFDTPYDEVQEAGEIPEEEFSSESMDESFDSVEDVEPELEGGRLLVCPKCVHSFYVQKG
jgi:hypothetical protein